MAGDDLAPALAALQLGSHHDDQQADVMGSSSRPKFVALPIEIILRILYSVGPRDLIRLRGVCNRFHQIIDDPSVWKKEYTDSRLPLPPGPFPWQSNQTLQRALIESERLGQAWTTQPLKLISKFASDCVIRGPKTQDKDRFGWVRGRWLLLSRQMKQLICRDVETNYEQTVWEGDEMSQWASCSVIGDRGHLIYVAMRMGPKCRLDDPVKLLGYEVDDDTGRLTGPIIYDVPTSTLRSEMFEPRLRLLSHHSPLVQICVNPSQTAKHTLVFDPQSRRFYKFPPFKSKLDDIVDYRGAWLPHLLEMYPTTTHILVLSRSWLIHSEIPRQVEVLQTFTIPDDADVPPDQFGVRELRLTHEYLTRDMSQMSREVTLIRNSVIDPVKKTTTLRFMHTFTPFPETLTQFVCTDYILPESSTGDVSPIIVESHEIFRLNGVWRSNLVEASDEGRVRGLSAIGYPYVGRQTPPDVVYKFEVDATGEQCVAVVGDPSPQMPGIDLSSSFDYAFDGFRGKFTFMAGDIWKRNAAGEWVNDDVVAFVVNFT